MNDVSVVKAKGQSNRSQMRARTELVYLLKEEHRHILNAFYQFHELLARSELVVAQSLIARTCEKLNRHAEVDRTVVYPAFCERPSTRSLFERADIEHQAHQRVIGILQAMDACDSKMIPAFQVLGAYFRHHVKLEENLICQRVVVHDVDWVELLSAVRQRQELLRLSSHISFGAAHYG